MKRGLQQIVAEFSAIEERSDDNPTIKAKKTSLRFEMSESLCENFSHIIRCLAIGPMDVSEARYFKSHVIDVFLSRGPSSLDLDRLSGDVTNLHEGITKNKITGDRLVALAKLVAGFKTWQKDRFTIH